MGTPVPDEFRNFINDKWYHVVMDSYNDATPADDCSQAYVGRASQCKTGAQISFWIDGGLECLAPFELVFLSGFTAQRLVSANGPYDNQAACIADNPV